MLHLLGRELVAEAEAEAIAVAPAAVVVVVIVVTRVGGDSSTLVLGTMTNSGY